MAEFRWSAFKAIATMALYAIPAFTGTANAAGVVSDVTVTPEPFNAGESVDVKIQTVGPFRDAMARVRVIGDGKVISDKRFSLGAIPSGPYSKTLDDAFRVKTDPQVTEVQVHVVMFEADETSEPTAKDGAVKFLGECARRTAPDVQPCMYATAKSRRSTK